MMVGGIVLSVLGTAALVGSIAKINYDETQFQASCPPSLGCLVVGSLAGLNELPWYALATFGGTLLATGTVLTIVGATPRRVGPWEPRVSVGPGSARLAWSF
jgi:hypothetical protein